MVLRKVISRNNYSFLEYEFPKGILSSNWEKTQEYFDIIRDEVAKDINQLKKEHKFNTVYVAGVSLGSFHACRIANGNKDITDLCLITSGHCLAETVWNGILTQHIKKDFEVQGITLQQLKKYWRELAPENNIENLKTKHVIIVISKADQVIPIYYGTKLLNSLKERKYNISYDINKNLGHLLTGLKFYSIPGKILFKRYDK
jgi:esterase/lipase